MEQPRRDLPARTFAFARRVVMLCQALDQTPGVSRTLANQLLRSGTSIGANVEEGQGSQSRADFVAKYSIACKEARETHYWLRLLVASEIAAESKLQDLIDEAMGSDETWARGHRKILMDVRIADTCHRHSIAKLTSEKRKTVKITGQMKT